MAKGPRLNAYFGRREAALQMAGTALRIEYVDATGPRLLEPTGPAGGEINFLIGPEQTWERGIPLLDGVAYRDLYRGIDMIYRGSGPNLKSEFIVAPGEDPGRIRLRYAGADPVRVQDDGSLAIRVGRHMLHESAPVIYQERDGARLPVEGGFQVNGDIVSFVVGGYDRSLPLTIDPVISYLTLLGGSGADAALSLAIDSTGAAYVAGFTASYDLPTANPEQNFNGGGNEVFVAKLNPAGSGLTYCTYIGGRGDDRAYGIAVDASGAAYVTGSTASTNFPVKGALQPKLAGGKNAFVLKLNPAGNTLVYSTYLGGNGSDVGNGIALDASGNAYVAGDTTSLNFPAGAFQKSNRGAPDGFVSKVAADGSRLLYSTYLGGSGEDHVTAIAVDAGGAAFVTGSTYSPDFPVANAYQPSLAGGQDAFVTRLSATGNSLIFSTYLGGSGGMLGSMESGHGLALDALGNAYVAGETSSTNFPIRGATQSTNAGWQDAFAAKFSPAGALVYSTYIGGVNLDIANAIAVDATGAAYIAGQTTSANLASILVSQNPPTGVFDAFVVKLVPTGDSVAALLYFGGVGADNATAIAVDAASNMYLAGWTLSPNLPVVNGFQTINGGNYSAFVGKMSFATAGAALALAKSHTGNLARGQKGATYTLVVSNRAGAAATIGPVTVTDTLPAGLTLASMSGTGWSCSGVTCSRVDALSAGASYPPITVTVNVAADAPPWVTNTAAVSGGGSATAQATDPTASPRAPRRSSNRTRSHAATGTADMVATGGASRTTPRLTRPMPK